MKQTPVTPIAPMDDLDPIFAERLQSQMDDPHVGQASGDYQGAEPFGVGEMTFIEMEPAAFLIRKECFNLETFVIPVKGFIGQVKVGHQEKGIGVTQLPASNDSLVPSRQSRSPGHNLPG